MVECDYEVCLISERAQDIDKQASLSGIDPQVVHNLILAWNAFRTEGLYNVKMHEASWATIENIGERLSSKPEWVGSPFIRRFRDIKNNHRFFILLNNHEHGGIPTFELYYLCTLWQIEHGSTPIHASGIIHQKQLFLFSGPSGAGKSTISRLSEELGNNILDEDQVLLSISPDGQFFAQAWGYSLKVSDAPLRAVFKIVQDSKNHLFRMPESQVSRFLLERASEVIGEMISDEVMKRLFNETAEIARHIPGYELHFRKSPDFWKLIDEHFPT